MFTSDESTDAGETIDLSRQVRQRLESLRRAGLDRVPKATGKPALAQPTKVVEPKPAPLIKESPNPHSPPLVAPPLARSLFDASKSEDHMPLIPPDQRKAALEVIQNEVSSCPRCPELVATRNLTVFGEGSSTARLMFIGEAPGADEDRTGRPFVGRAGQLLTDMITKGMGLSREDVFIANVLKCRPPGNRPPLSSEVANCRGYLERQLQIIRPEFLCLLGKTAAAALLDVGNQPMSKLRGRWFEVEGIKTLITYHPAYLLRSPAHKRDTWDDLQLLMAELGLPNPRKSS